MGTSFRARDSIEHQKMDSSHLRRDRYVSGSKACLDGLRLGMCGVGGGRTLRIGSTAGTMKYDDLCGRGITMIDNCGHWGLPPRHLLNRRVRWHDADNDGTFEPDANEMHYYTNGANFNVTALLDANSGDVVERYLYDPYGRRTVLNGHTDADPNVTEWHPDGDNRSDANNPLGHQGLPHDAETGYIHNRNRYRCSMIGRWLQWDFLQYPDGMSLCQYLGSAPTLGTDPSGLEATTQPNVQWSPFLSSKHADYPYTSHYYADTIACPGGPASLEYMVGHQLMGYTQRRPNGEPQRRPDGTVVRVGAQDLLTSPDLPCKAPFNAVRRIQTSLKTWVYKIIGQGERYDTKTYLEGRYGIGAMITQKKDKDGCICWKLKFIVTFWELKGYPPVDELPERRRRFVSDPTVGKNHHWFSQGRSVYPAKGNAGVPLAVGASDLAPGGAAGTEKAGIELEMRRWVCCRAPDVETGVMIVDCPYIKVPVKAVLGRARTHPGQVKPVFWNVVQLWGENGIQSQQGNMQKPPQKD